MVKKKIFTKTIRILIAAVFMLSIMFSSYAAQAASGTITNDTFWKDTSGNPIYSQGGGIFKFNGVYYWYGVKYNGAVTYYNNPTAKNGDTSFNAVTCYSSTDLVNWTFEKNVLTANTPGLEGCTWLGRLGVAYNSTTNKYVLVTQFFGNNGSGVLFATCSTPTGDFAYNRIQPQITNVVNAGTGDQTLFIDSDGKAYLVFSSSSGRSNMYVAPLRASDYLNVEPATRIFNGAGREGNCMFKYNGRYYACSSDLHGWNSSHCYVISSSNIYGPYSSETIMTNSGKDFCHVSQTGFFVTVTGTSGTTVIFCGDRWSDFAGNGEGYNQWCPVTFNGTTPIFNSVSKWNLDAAAGTWSVADGNNYVMNPTFEADRVSQNALAGWTSWDNVSGDPNSNNSDHYGPGRWCMTQSYSSAYQASRYQSISGLPNGTYTLSAWVKSSGGQSACYMYIKNYGGSELRSNFNSAISSWQKVTISNINVTNGQCELGVFSNANANNWCRVDGLSLTKGSGGGSGGDSYVKIANAATGLCVDGYGYTDNGSVCNQYANNSSYNQQWLIETAGSYVKLKNRATGLYLDGLGNTTNGSDCGQWSSSSSSNQQWTQETAGSYVKFKNRATGLYLDGMGRTENGSALGQYAGGSSSNQRWSIVNP